VKLPITKADRQYSSINNSSWKGFELTMETWYKRIINVLKKGINILPKTDHHSKQVHKRKGIFRKIISGTSNAKIYVKLIGAFTAVMLFLLIVGAAGVISMNFINNNGQKNFKVVIDSVSMISKIKYEIANNEVNLLGAIESVDSAKAETASVTAVKNSKQIFDDILSYQKQFGTKDNYEILKKVKNNYSSYMDIQTIILEYVSEGQLQKAMDRYNKADSDRKGLFASLDEMIALNKTMIDKVNQDNRSIFASSVIVMGIVIIAGLFISILLSLSISRYVTTKIKKAVRFAEALAKGDLTESMDIESTDEMGMLAKSLNTAGENLKSMVSKITAYADKLNYSSEELSATTQEFTSQMESISESTGQISQMVDELSTSIGETNDISQGIAAAAGTLSQKSEEGDSLSVEIMKRAADIKFKGIDSQKSANAIYEEKLGKVTEAIESGKVVKEISAMAGIINNIK
jgi:methyl-accepting chemotaxis protein